jgi:hypothetical protein
MQNKKGMIILGLVAGLCMGQAWAGSTSLSRTTALTTTIQRPVSVQLAPVEARTWVALDSRQKPGTPARVSLNRDKSSPQQTLFDLDIYGFWMTDKKGPDGEIYQQIEIPGLGSHNQTGAPDLPLYHFNLALPFHKGEVRLSARAEDVRSYDGILVWPQPVPELDGEKETGTPEKFVMDKRIYGARTAWPGRPGQERYTVGTALRNLPAVQGQVWPVQWNPATRQLQVPRHVSYLIDHPGEPERFEPLTQERYRLASKYFINWELLENIFVPNWWFYTASFLFIYPDRNYADEIKPLVDQKKARGFKVTEMNVADDIGASTCTDIRNAIIAWEAAVPSSHDAYALLVGDTNVIPHCTSPTGDQTDDLYASTNGDDLDEEIYLGRLSVDDETDLANQVAKILEYEDSPSLFCCYPQVGLWAHKEGAPGKYEGAHETVRTFGYSNPPAFITYYGSQAGVTDSDIVAEVNSGVGLMAYRGHGSSSSTATGWNQTSEYFNGTDVASLANPLSLSPVVWSFACTNAKLDIGDSIAEQWMEQVGTGSVSYYGATRTSYTSQNHVLDEWMFRAVYDEGLTTQSHAIERAEDQMASLSGSDNAWMYLLLGDPDMQIRTENPFNFTIKIPELIRICKFCELPIQVFDPKGNPVANALVGLWKAASDKPNAEGETWVNGYTDSKGYVSLPYSALTTGVMYYSVEDARGNTEFNAIKVVR